MNHSNPKSWMGHIRKIRYINILRHIYMEEERKMKLYINKKKIMTKKHSTMCTDLLKNFMII